MQRETEGKRRQPEETCETIGGMDDESGELWRCWSSLFSSTKLDRSGQKCCLLSMEEAVK